MSAGENRDHPLWGYYPGDWPACPACGKPALDGHVSCGEAGCDELKLRRERGVQPPVLGVPGQGCRRLGPPHAEPLADGFYGHPEVVNDEVMEGDAD